jgi:hypothetical protein
MSKARYAILASVCTGCLVSGPIFYSLALVALAEVPPHAQPLQGGGKGSVWKGMDANGDTVYLRFNRWGMASFTSPEHSQKGPVTFEERSLTLQPIPVPLLASLSTPRTLAVAAWPSEARPDVAIVDGVQLYRME